MAEDKPKVQKICACGKPAKPHWDQGLFCGDDQCDICFEEMRRKCRQRSW